MKQKYYSCENIKKVNADYNIVLGERSNGKSYSICVECLIDAWENDGLFVYLRRWKDETQNVKVEAYFNDKPIEKITKGQATTILCYRQELFFANIDETGKKIPVKKCGSVMYLKGEQRYKSMSFPEYKNMLFEEMITKDGYLYDEPLLLQSLVSTVFRRRKGRVWLIGNKISRVCPYFSFWQLTNTTKQKNGTIDVYKFETSQKDEETGEKIVVKIAVEMTDNTSNNSKMFFGQTSKMTTGGEWESKDHPKLLKPKKEYHTLYRILLEYDSFHFWIEILADNATRETFLYIYPCGKNKEKFDRKISDRFDLNALTTPYLSQITKGDILVDDLLKNRKVCYSDNLTGADFENIIKTKGGKL